MSLKPELSPFKRGDEILTEYWQRLRGSRAFPREQEVHAEDIADIWDSCFLITLHDSYDDAPRYVYAYAGAALEGAYGRDIAGSGHHDEDMPRMEALAHALRAVTSQGVPVTDSGEFTNRQQARIGYCCCLLPLGDGGQIEHILGYMRWKQW